MAQIITYDVRGHEGGLGAKKKLGILIYTEDKAEDIYNFIKDCGSRPGRFAIIRTSVKVNGVEKFFEGKNFTPSKTTLDSVKSYFKDLKERVENG